MKKEALKFEMALILSSPCTTSVFNPPNMYEAKELNIFYANNITHESG